jgi:hypothetical protein
VSKGEKNMKQFTKEQAIKLAKGGEWKDWTDEEIVKFQLYQKKLCMDFHRFHVAVGNVLGRPVYTHEFSNMEALIDEYEKEKPSPTFEEILNMIPEEKRIVLEL